ncbi:MULTISPECIES: (2Fe-2S)-binding protein [unclassified Bradyrhizobium]|uniref:(2Fe-2S)-binding protein n=1 Tax=unclassified Bradyrhizobium TaxID=2631580 RepID=UPI00247AEB73|nr:MULTISPECIES: (2Fe-2S)-binding protein [unclassified Bradyrhizobium]WGS19302.1 (2Fe-2S)-binding protein [Bradyrhizobium sp. ISRA463]WGS26137.1 (2Fe-2S)-binding protein [Bradyrhizobium sp. ISRA464]
MTTQRVDLTINGATYSGQVEPRMLLSDFIRQVARLTGTHVGCEHGVCGVCTVQIDGMTARSCLTFAIQAEGHDIRTVEALGKQGALHPIQQAFWEKHGLQCGYCTPGMLMRAEEFLASNPNPGREDIIEGISGNLCRCTGYQTIVDAIEHAATLSEIAKGGGVR